MLPVSPSDMLIFYLLCQMFSIVSGVCYIPSSWYGKWFEHGRMEPFMITNITIESKGRCIESKDGKYMFEDSDASGEGGGVCAAIFEAHPYVLQYKEVSFEMTTEDDIDKICEAITGDEPLKTMFRIDDTVIPIACPFEKISYGFSYTHDTKDVPCHLPISRLDPCTEDYRIRVKYGACPDTSFEERQMIVTCLATWKRGNNHFLLGKVNTDPKRTITEYETDYRCIIYNRINDDKYQIGISSNAECAMASINEADERLTLEKQSGVPRCNFPAWVTTNIEYYDLKQEMYIIFDKENATIKYPSNIGEERITCISIESSKDHEHMTFAVFSVHECTMGYKCVQFYKRDLNIMEMRITDTVENALQDACTSSSFTTNTILPITTFVAKHATPRVCPALEKWLPPSNLYMKNSKLADDGCNDATLHSFTLGCNNEENKIEMKVNCQDGSVFNYAVYYCLGNWRGDGMNYVVASSMNYSQKEVPRYYCFLYNHSNSSLHLEVANATCRSNPDLSLNLKSHESCNSELSSNPKSSSNANGVEINFYIARFIIVFVCYYLYGC